MAAVQKSLKVVVIDRDRDSAEKLRTTLVQQGHQAIVLGTKTEALEALKLGDVDCLYFDPYPQVAEARAYTLMVRRTVKPAPVIVLIGHGEDEETARKLGANALLPKPYGSAEQLAYVTESTARLVHLGHELVDAGAPIDGILNKAAFHQLYLACLDRADRYNEKSFFIRVEIENYDALGADAPKVAAGLRDEMARIKRMSDLGGHLEPHLFGMLLMRPMREDEPVLAANRMAEFIMRDFTIIAGTAKPNIKVELIELPTGKRLAQHFLPNI